VFGYVRMRMIKVRIIEEEHCSHTYPYKVQSSLPVSTVILRSVT